MRFTTLQSRSWLATHRRRLVAVACVALTGLSLMSVTGCNDAQAGSLFGAGGGALLGQAIGHDTSSTLIGAGAGAIAGYIIGNESDKERMYGRRGYGGREIVIVEDDCYPHRRHYYERRYYRRGCPSNYDY